MTPTLGYLPCPFCASDDVHLIQKLNHHEVACFHCGAVANAPRWNERAGLPSVHEALQCTTDALDDLAKVTSLHMPDFTKHLQTIVRRNRLVLAESKPKA